MSSDLEASEDTPLLHTPAPNDISDDPVALKHEQLYKRFSPAHKRIIVAIVSWSGLIPMFVSGSFIPSIPQIAKDLHSTGEVINLAVSLSLASAAVGSMLWATYSGFYGRRVVFLVSLPCFCVGSLMVGLAQDVPSLLLWRIFQAFGSASGFTLGAAVIGDIYKLEERGTAMGVFLSMILLGPAIAPIAGGAASHYLSWRWLQHALGVMGVAGFVLIIFFLPETLDPEILRTRRDGGQKTCWVWLNPFSGLALLRSPNVLAVTVACTLVLLTDYVLLVPLSYTIGAHYGITNEAIVGALFIPAGIGNIIGAPLAGRISDSMVVYWREKRGKWMPEDRLRATLYGALFFTPLSVLISGLLTQYVHGWIGLSLNLVCLLFNGIGIDVVLSPSSAYFVDIMHSRSAEVMASTMAFRAFIIAIATAWILPFINEFGVVPVNACSAILGWIGFGLLWSTIQYGEEMRAWVDIGYSTTQNN